MTAQVRAPEILIADADPWTADLLAQLVLAVRGDARVTRVADGQAALARCRRRLPALVIADSELPVLDGLDLLRQVRRHPRSPALPFILISSRLDARSVRAARPLAPTAYLAKPFNAEHLRQRLGELLARQGDTASVSPAPAQADTLEGHLDAMREEGQGAPLLASVRDAVSRCLGGETPDLRDLERLFADDPQITARLIAAANSAAHHHGAPCQTLGQALPRLGVPHSLNLVLGMAVQRNARLSDPRLSEQALRAWDAARRSAELAHWLALELGLDAELCFTAGLLHNIGELALLRSLQGWQDAGGRLGDGDIEQAMRQRAAGFGSALRSRWRLPFALRELIAAFYGLQRGVFSREALVLNLAGEVLGLDEGLTPLDLQASRCVSLLRLDSDLLARLPMPDAAA